MNSRPLAVFVINEEKAEIVRRIYREFLAGITVTRICRGLEADGIPTKLGKTKWQHNVIKSIRSPATPSMVEGFFA